MNRQELLEKARLGLEAKDFQSKIENETLYLCIDFSEFELSDHEIEFQVDEYDRLLEEENENFK